MLFCTGETKEVFTKQVKNSFWSFNLKRKFLAPLVVPFVLAFGLDKRTTRGAKKLYFQVELQKEFLTTTSKLMGLQIDKRKGDRGQRG